MGLEVLDGAASDSSILSILAARERTHASSEFVRNSVHMHDWIGPDDDGIHCMFAPSCCSL